jgi:hypothetical protein
VPRLALLLRDLYLPRAPDPGEAAPRLPALERWLSRGSAVTAPAGWRGWLAQAVLGTDLPSGEGGAGVTGAALLGAAAGRYFWFATPVHYLAGLDTIHLPAAGLLRLSPHEQQTLAEDFARVFGDSRWRLHTLGFRDLLLEGPDPGAHETDDPAAAAGRDLAAAQPRGSGTRPLRQLSAEVEMWLHEHPLNLERERRGDVPVGGLWFWGGGSAPRHAGARPLVRRIYADDAFSAALAATAGLELQSAPANAASLPTPGEPTVVVLSGTCAAGWGDLLRLEQLWFEPLLAQLAGGGWRSLTLVLGARQQEFRAAHRWRGWRRARAWWEELPR